MKIAQPLASFILLLLVFHSSAVAEEKTVQQLYTEAKEISTQGPPRTQEVIVLLKKALEKQPTHLDSIKLLTQTYFTTKQYDDAVTMLDSAIARTKSREPNPLLYLLKARALLEEGKITQASDVLIAKNAVFQNDKDIKESYQQVKRNIDENFTKLLFIANQKAKNVGFETTDCVKFVIDKYRKPESYPTIPFLPLLTAKAVQNDWWIVVYLPKKGEQVLAVYLDKKSRQVMEHQTFVLAVPQAQNLAEYDQLTIATAAFEHAIKMEYLADNHLFIIVDKLTDPGVISDSRIQPFITERFKNNDWWAVVILPLEAAAQPVCIYINKKDLTIEELKWGQGSKTTKPASLKFKLTGWQTGKIRTESGVPHIALQPIIENPSK